LFKETKLEIKTKLNLVFATIFGLFVFSLRNIGFSINMLIK